MMSAVVILAGLLRFAGQGEPVDAQALIRSGDYEAAISTLEKTLQVGEKGRGHEAAALALAECYLSMGLFTRAGKALELLAPSASRSSRCRYVLAEVLASRGETAEAEKILASLSGKDGFPGATFRLSVLLFERGDYRNAAEHLAVLSEAGRLDYYGEIYRVRALLALDRASEALAAIASLGKKHDTPEVRYLSGRASLLLRRHGAAAEQFRLALAANSDYLEAAFSLARSLGQEGDKAGAAAAMRRFKDLQQVEKTRTRKANLLSQRCRREPDDAAAWLDAGEFYLSIGDADQAVSHSWRALVMDRESVRGRLLLARALRNAGAYAQSALHYRKVITQSPGNQPAVSELRELIRKHARK
ncbi:MAG: tetratricopeptide repeat protein [Planctomycetota bacterium]|nr:tetratricopeptide repeat protein [Planctomycetota bacterium]